MTARLLFASASTALLLAACDGPPPAPPGVGPNVALKVADKLNCPERQGRLDRIRVAADGKSCLYRGEDDTEVELRIMPLAGDADATLKGLEQQLRPLVLISDGASDGTPAAAPGDAAPADAKAAARIDAAAAADAGVPASAKAEAAADAEADAEDEDWGDHDVHVDVDRPVRVALPGIRIDANGETDKADIRIGPLRINADGANDSVIMSRKPAGGVGHDFSLVAKDDRAEIRVNDGGKANVKSMLILASDDPGPEGYQLVGYVARGPRNGPLVVATVRSKSGDHDHALDNAGDLVKKNVRRR
jgi:hypothetical protein